MIYNKDVKRIGVTRGGKKMKNIIALQNGWKNIHLNHVTKMQKSWTEEREGYMVESRVDVYFGRLCDGRYNPVVIMNVYKQGAGTKEVIDDNCDVWTNVFARTTTDEGNEYFKYLRKHGFSVVK